MTGANLRDVRRQWIEAGGSVQNINRTGEDKYIHPDLHRAYVVNSRRKDAPRMLTTALRKIVKT